MIKNTFKLSDPYNYYNDLEYSLNDPLSFWNEVSSKYKVHWDKPYDKVLNYNSDTKKSEWFKGGLINACYNALDLNIKNGKRDQVAFAHELPIKKLCFTITYQQLYDQVCIFSRALRNLGVKKGDVVLVYMHNSIQTIIVMLSCARLGAVHSVMYGGSLSGGLTLNINDCKPKVIVTSSFGYFANDSPHYYLPILQEALSKSTHKPDNIIVYYRNDIPDVDYSNPNLSKQIIDGSLDWNELVKDLEPLLEYEPVESQHPLYLIYSSGTTNRPKGIVRETGSQVVVLNYAARANYKLREDSTYYTSASFGWVSTHSFLIYGMLFVGAKSVFIEGPFKNVIEDYFGIAKRQQVSSFLITPLLARKFIQFDPEGELIAKYDLSSVEFATVGGERVHQSIIDYLSKVFKKPVLNECWQTEQGWQMFFNPVNQFPVKGNSIGKVAPGGYQIKIVKHSNDGSKVVELGPNEQGEIAIKLPLPPLVTNNLFNDDSNSTLYNQNYLNKYPSYFATGDIGSYDQDGYYFYVSRVGDSIACGNSHLNCSVVENDILNNTQINECCIIGLKDEILVNIPLVLLVLKYSNEMDKVAIDSIKTQVSNHIKNVVYTNTDLKPVVLNVKNIPKNRNGKVLKSLVKSIFNGESFEIPPTIENQDVVSELMEEYNKLTKSN